MTLPTPQHTPAAPFWPEGTAAAWPRWDATAAATAVGTPLPAHEPGNAWPCQRRVPSPSDLRLRIDTAQWIAQLDAAHRPIELALRYPRLANRLCTLWPDSDAARHGLLELLQDHRGGRQGFPPEVQAELRQLLVHCEWRLGG